METKTVKELILILQTLQNEGYGEAEILLVDGDGMWESMHGDCTVGNVGRLNGNDTKGVFLHAS